MRKFILALSLSCFSLSAAPSTAPVTHDINSAANPIPGNQSKTTGPSSLPQPRAQGPMGTILPSKEVLYTHPGIVVQEGSRWVGSDHLLNLSKRLDVVAEILKPQSTSLPFTEEQMTAKIADLFQKKGFITNEPNAGLPSQPFFDMLIVVYPIEQGFVALCDGRLIEKVDISRVILNKDTLFQAITWEKKTLVVAPKDEFLSTINKTIEDIVNTFFERFDYFDRIKNRMEQPQSTIDQMQ